MNVSTEAIQHNRLEGNGAAPGQEEVPMARDGNNARASWSFSLHHVRQNTAHCRPEAAKALVDLFLFAVHSGLTREEVSRAVGIDSNTLYKHLTGRYKSPQTGERLDLSEAHLRAIQQWLSLQRALAAKRTDFVETATAKKVFNACDIARESHTVVMLYGPSHIGKTWALETYSEQHNHGDTPYIRVRAAGGILGLLRVMASAVGVSPNTNREALKENVFNALHRDQVIIFDEVHQLLWTYQHSSFMACIEFIREVHDQTGCGMVLAMTNFGRDELVVKRRAQLEQTLRRGVHRVQLPAAPLRADLGPILRAHGLEFPAKSLRVAIKDANGRDAGEEPWKLIRQLGKEEGLKAITERLRYARKVATKRGADDPTWDDFVAAHFTIERNAVADDDWNTEDAV